MKWLCFWEHWGTSEMYWEVHCFFLKRKDFFYSYYLFKRAKLAKFIRFEAGWKMMRDDVIMWWCGDLVMRWRPRIKNMRHWVLCKTTAPKDNTTLTETIFFSPTLKGGKLFIVSCEFWFFYTQRFFYILYVFKEAKLAKFIRFEAGWKMMRDDVICDDVMMWWWDGSHGLKIRAIGFINQKGKSEKSSFE